MYIQGKERTKTLWNEKEKGSVYKKVFKLAVKKPAATAISAGVSIRAAKQQHRISPSN